MRVARRSPIEEGEIADDLDYSTTYIADTSRDNYEQLNMDIETDTESMAKDQPKDAVDMDDADALRQLLLSQFNNKKMASSSSSFHDRNKSSSSEDRRRSGKNIESFNDFSLLTSKNRQQKSTTDLSKSKFSVPNELIEEARDRQYREMYVLQRKLRKAQSRLWAAHNRKKTILKSLNDCEATITNCERQIGEIADSMFDVFKRTSESSAEHFRALERGGSGPFDVERLSQGSGRESNSPVNAQRFTVMPPRRSTRRRSPSVNDEELRNKQTNKPVVNQLSPSKGVTSSSSLAKQQNQILDEKLRELELEMLTNTSVNSQAEKAQVDSAPASYASNKLEANPEEMLEMVSPDGENDGEVEDGGSGIGDEEVELIIREEDFYTDDEMFNLPPPPKPPSSTEMNPPRAEVEENVEEELQNSANSGEPEELLDIPITEPSNEVDSVDAEKKELEILSRMVLRRTQIQVANYHKQQMAAMTITASSSKSDTTEVMNSSITTSTQTTTLPTSSASNQLTLQNSGSTDTTAVAKIVANGDENAVTSDVMEQNQHALGFWKTRKRAKLDAYRQPNEHEKPEMFCADEEIQKFKKSISMAKNVVNAEKAMAVNKTATPSLPTVAPQSNRSLESVLKSKTTPKELQNPLIFLHSYRQHATSYKMTDVDIVCDFLRIRQLCPSGMTPESYAKRLLENYSVEDVARYFASKVPDELRSPGSSWAYFPPSTNGQIPKSDASFGEKIEYNSLLPNYLAANR